MKRIKISVLAAMLTITMSMPCIAFAYGDYTNYTKGNNTIGTLTSTLTMDSLADYYYDASGTYSTRDKNSISISFTDDMKSSMSSYAKIKTYEDTVADKYPASYLFDAGNFSMGDPYQTIFEAEAAELRIMGSTGYDAATLGSAELSHGADGLAAMLKRAVNSGDTVPNLVAANISGGTTLTNAFNKYGVQDYIVVDNYGVKVAVFGIMGKDSFDSVSAKGIKLADPVDSANKVVSEIKKNEDVDMIVCLANTGNGGSDTKQTEAKDLASGTDGIDLIIAGNSSATLTSPIEENGTEIVSAGAGSNKIGTVTFTKSGNAYKYKSCKLTSLNSKITDDYTVSSDALRFKYLYNTSYFSKYGYTYLQKLTTSDFGFTGASRLGNVEGDDPLGDIISDAYLKSAKNKADISAVSAGAVTGTLHEGTIKTKDAFAVLSKGVGEDGRAGYQLVSFKLKGNQIRSLAETGSKPSDSKPERKLYFGGLTYTYNPHRIKTNRVYDISVNGAGLNKDKSYTVVADEYTYKQIKDILGTNTAATTLYRSGGNEQKAWSSLADYLKAQGSTISSAYSKADGRATYDKSFNPVNLFKQPNKMVAVFASIAVIIIAVILLLLIFMSNIFGNFRHRGSYEPKRRRRKHYPKQSKQKPIFSNKKRF